MLYGSQILPRGSILPYTIMLLNKMIFFMIQFTHYCLSNWGSLAFFCFLKEKTLKGESVFHNNLNSHEFGEFPILFKRKQTARGMQVEEYSTQLCITLSSMT